MFYASVNVGAVLCMYFIPMVRSESDVYDILGRVLWVPTGLGWLSWLGFLRVLLWINCFLFPVGLVDQLFQPTQNPVEKRWVSTAITIVGSYPCVMSNAILFDTVGVWCPPSPGIRPCFSTQFNRKWLKCVLLVHFNHINENRSCQGLGNWARVRANNRILKSNSARTIVNLLQSLQSAVDSSTLLLESLEGVFFL